MEAPETNITAKIGQRPQGNLAASSLEWETEDNRIRFERQSATKASLSYQPVEDLTTSVDDAIPSSQP